MVINDIYNSLLFCNIVDISNCLYVNKTVVKNSDTYLWPLLCRRDYFFIINCNHELFHYFTISLFLLFETL